VESTGKSRYRDVFRNRDFRLLTGAFVIDQIGGWASSVVLIVWIFDRTHSPTWIAATTAAGWVPRAICSTYAGVLADRYERTKVMFTSAMLAFVAATALALVVARNGPPALALCFCAVLGAFISGYRPASGAVLPDIVGERELVAANGVFGALESMVVVVGPGIGGLMLVAGSPAAGIALNAMSFLAAALIVARLKVRSYGDAGAAGEGLRQQVTEGFSALWQQRIAFVLVAFCCLDSAVYAASTIINVPLSEQLGTGSNGYSYLVAAFALGGVVAAGLANRCSAALRLAPVLLLGMFLLALPFAALGYVHQPAVAFVLLVVSGVGMVIVDVLAITALQREVRREVLSRVFGIFESALPASLLVASFITAAILHAIGLKGTLLAIGFGFAGASVLGIGPVVRADRKSTAVVRALRPRIALFESLDLFAGASKAALERLAAAATESSLPAASTVIREGAPADALWVLTEGTVSVTARGEGLRTRRLREMTAPAYFGEIGILRGLPRTATVRTDTTCTLLRIEADEFLAAVQGAGVSGTMLAQSASRLARSHPKLAETTTVVIPQQRTGEPDEIRLDAPAEEHQPA
jgi:CRP-like cAMP-binding protein/predicted MFS family arabinose efflux permease